MGGKMSGSQQAKHKALMKSIEEKTYLDWKNHYSQNVHIPQILQIECSAQNLYNLSTLQI